MYTTGLLALSHAGEFLQAIELKYLEETQLLRSCVSIKGKQNPLVQSLGGFQLRLFEIYHVPYRKSAFL